MTVTIYHNPDCGAARNVRGLIRSEEPRIIENLKTPPSREELKDLIARMQMPVRDVLRQKGMPYEALGLGDPKLSDDQLLDAMMAHPILINRPIIVTEEREALPPVRGGAREAAAARFRKEDGEAVVATEGSRILRPAP